MPSDFAFRLSTYLSLALSCACLGYSERDLFPEVPYFTGAVILALAVLFRLESRVEFLSIPAANRVGMVVGALNFTWVGCRYFYEMKKASHLSPQLLLLALFGPLLMT